MILIGDDGGSAAPYGPRIWPDGKRFTGAYGTWTWADRFTSPATESGFEKR